MKPSVGRIVHYQTQAGNTLPAMIVKVHNDTCVNLHVFQDSNEPGRWMTSVVQGTGPITWAWPVITPEKTPVPEAPAAVAQADGAGVCVK
jgi:hypothetical protein